MDKKAIIILVIWIILAVIDFLAAFVSPYMFFKIIGWIFGAINFTAFIALFPLVFDNIRNGRM